MTSITQAHLVPLCIPPSRDERRRDETGHGMASKCVPPEQGRTMACYNSLVYRRRLSISATISWRTTTITANNSSPLIPQGFKSCAISCHAISCNSDGAVRGPASAKHWPSIGDHLSTNNFSQVPSRGSTTSNRSHWKFITTGIYHIQLARLN